MTAIIELSTAHPDPRLKGPRRRPTIYDLRLPELQGQFNQQGIEPYRGRQVYEWLYRKLATSYQEMTPLPLELRAKLSGEFPLDAISEVRQVVTDNQQTIKTLYTTHDCQLLETVLMFYPDRVTICVSCQVGCAVGCAFCATGIGGLQRNLAAGEMVAQVVDSARKAAKAGRSLTNIVMMGMGEPFHNYRETIRFIAILNDAAGMNVGARRFTVSTAGIVPAIEKLADEPYQVNLAISLHAPNDELRGSLVPINNRYPVAELMRAARSYIARTGRRISFQYALMKGINDSDEIALELAALLRGMLCHVNIIPLNPVDVLPYERPDPAAVARFARILEEAGTPTTVRYSRGVDIAAACGQLRAQQSAVAV